jgi:hypothetical protein
LHKRCASVEEELFVDIFGSELRSLASCALMGDASRFFDAKNFTPAIVCHADNRQRPIEAG